jgi:cysteine synthase A
MAHYLLRFEGLFLGSSSALNCVAALRAAAELRARKPSGDVVVLTVLCDAGHRYLSRFWNRDFVEARGLAWPPDDAAALEAAARALVKRPDDEAPTFDT